MTGFGSIWIHACLCDITRTWVCYVLSVVDIIEHYHQLDLGNSTDIDESLKHQMVENSR